MNRSNWTALSLGSIGYMAVGGGIHFAAKFSLRKNQIIYAFYADEIAQTRKGRGQWLLPRIKQEAPESFT